MTTGRVGRSAHPRPHGRVLAAVAGFTAAAVVLGVLVGRSDGYAATSVDADPQDVWVTNPAQYLVGRVNTQIDELDSAALLDGDGYDVLQDGRRVLVVDPDNHRLRALDVATVSLGPPVRLPDRAAVALGGDVLAVADRATGAVWAVPADALPAAAIADADAAFRSAPGVAVTAAADGTVAAVAPGARAVLVLPAGGGAPRQVPLAAPAPSESAGRPAAPPAPDGDPRSGDDRQATVTVTMVGDTPVVLDAAAGRLWAAGRSFRLPAGSADPVLQQPGPSAAAVLVATDAALLRVSLADGTVQAFDPGVRGRPAAPVWLRGCAHGAWAGATPSYLRWCGSVPTIRPVPTGPDGTDAGGGSLVFRVNGDTMVLNDMATGNVWVPDDAMVLVNNWQQVAPQRQQSADDAQQPDPGRASRLTLSRTDCSGGMSPPDAADDDLGVRAGRPVLLPVMSNDVVSDCSVTVIDQVSPLPPDIGSVRIVDAGRALQVTTDAAVTGDLPAIHYRISDGAGHSAQATAAVHVVPDDQHPPPAMLRDSAAVVALGGTTTRNVLTDWISPAGDPLFLTGARTDDRAMTVGYGPDGTITIADSGAGHPRKRTVDFVVSDGVNSAQGTLTVDVVADTDLVPVPSPVYATGVPGRPVTVHPLDSVLSLSADPLRLAAVSPAPGVTGIDIDADAAAGSVVVTARRPGHYYLSFQVVSGSQTADGVIRVDIADPSDDRAPVPVTDIAYLPQGGDVRVDLTGNDAVLGGGVLAVQQIDVDQDSGLTVTLADLHVATISAHRELDPSGVWFSYTVSAGASPATGWVHVVPVPARSAQAPVAGPMSVTVRAGDAVTVPAGSAARDFGGSALTVQPFDPLPAGSGLLFAASQDIRYLAPSGGLGQGVRTTYTVQNTEGRTASAPLQIRVVPQGVNHPPRAPTTTTARAFTGQTVSIALPLDGIDPDGDWVVATAIATAPEGGRAEVAGPNTITFTASDTPGPVSFDYTVADPSGATATGTVLVGVVDRPDLLLPPVAPDLTVTVPPGGTLAVDVLSSVTDPSGLPVDFADPGLTGAGGTAVVGRITDDRVVITAGDKPGVLPLTYTVQNSGGLTASGVITVRVSPDAPPVPPTAHDAYVTPDMVSADRRTARVDVSGLVANPGGAPDDWHLEVPEVDGRAVSLAGSRSLRVVLTGGRQVLAYRVRNTAGLTASAFIVVPGRSDLIPDNTLPGPPTVPPSSPPNVAPSTANGPTSRTSSPTTSAPTRSTTQVSLPAPTMDSARVSVQAGGSTTVQLDKLVRHHARYPQLRFTGPAGAGNGIAATLQGNRLRVSAGIGAEVGATAELTVTVSDGVHPPVQGHLDVVVARTTAPLPTVPDATVQAASGKSSTVNMLSGASNPLSDRGPLRVTDARVTSGDATVGADPGGSVTVTPAGTELGTVTVLVTVTDPANRTVSATLTVTVLGPPGAPGTPSIAAVGDRSVTLTWPASDDHGSAVRHYVVHGQGVDFDCLQRTTCPVSGLTNGRTYTFTVTASNDIGTSVPSAASAPATPDVAPEAPAAPRVTAGDRQLGVSWDKPENHGSPIASYRVTISPKPVSGAAAVSTPNRNYTFRGLANGTAYTVTVAARNSTGSYGPESAPSDPATPAAPPSAPPAPQVDFSQADGANSIDVSWARPAHDGGDPALRYTVHWSGSEDAGSGRIDAGTARTATIPDVRLGASYTVWVVAVNKAGASPESARATVTPVTAPERVAGLTAAPTGTGGQVALQWAEPASGGRDITGYQYRYRAGDTWTAWTPTGATATSATVTDLANGTRFEFSVRACNAASSCGPGSATAAANPYAPPAAIADLSAYGTGTSGEVKVTWTAPAGNGRAIAGYQYRYKSSGDYTAWTDSPQGTATSFSLQGFTNGTNYTFQVRALTAAEPGDAGGRTHLSDPSNTDVAKPCTVPSTMKAPTGSATGTTSIKLRWSAPFDGGRAIDTYQYRVYRGSTVERGWTDAGSGSSHTVTDLKAGTNYRFQVRACNSVGCGGPSAKSSAVKTASPPPAAQLVHGASVSNSQCNVNCYYFKVNYQNLRSGSYTVTLYLDGSAWRHYTWSLGGDGSHQATSYAGKNAGRNARVVLKGPSGTVDTGWRAWP